MLNKRKVLYSLKDVAIMPATISTIEHRSECNPYYEDGKLPIFTAPMPCVVDANTFSNYDEHRINAILPRTEPIGLRLYNCDKLWCAFSLTEFEKHFIKNKEERVGCHLYILIDVANGNMLKLYEMAKEAKEFYGDNLKLMVGNVANPKTFEKFCEIGVDYVRCSVGSGAGCCTATCCGILYPLASLIDECYQIKMEDHYHTKIVADGGLSSFRRMIKALALGADYVMLGSVLNKLEDSAGEIIPRMVMEDGHLVQGKVKEYYGMASEKGMKMLGKTGTPEGKIIYNKCEGTIESFVEEFTGYLKSTMSYCDINDIKYFIGGPELNVLSTNASNQFNQSR